MLLNRENEHICGGKNLLTQLKKLLLSLTLITLCSCCSVISACDSTGTTPGTLKAAACPFNALSTITSLLKSRSLIMVAAVILIISLTYLFYLTVEYLITKSIYSKRRLILKIVELKTTIKKLRKEIARLNRERTGSLEYIIDAEESPINEIQELDPQKMKDLAALANRLRSQ